MRRSSRSMAVPCRLKQQLWQIGISVRVTHAIPEMLAPANTQSIDVVLGNLITQLDEQLTLVNNAFEKVMRVFQLMNCCLDEPIVVASIGSNGARRSWTPEGRHHGAQVDVHRRPECCHD